MDFSFSNFFKGDDDKNKIVLVEEDKDVDYLDKLSKEKGDSFFGEKKEKKTIEIKETDMAVNAIEEDTSGSDKIKLIVEASGLSREKIDEFYLKMKNTSGSAKRMIESVLEMMSEEEKKDMQAESLIRVLGKKLSSESLAKIASAMIILTEEEEIDRVLDAGKKEGLSLSEKLKSAGIESK